MFGMPFFLPDTLTQWTIVALVACVLFLFILLAVLWFKSRRLEKKLAAFMGGKDGKDLEQVLLDQVAEVKELDSEIQELFEISNRLRELCMKSIHKTSVLRFNPFKEVGSNQSFSVALLNGKNSGAIISSLHTREGTRVYAKPVENGLPSGFPFTDEEKAVIAEASGKAQKI